MSTSAASEPGSLPSRHPRDQMRPYQYKQLALGVIMRLAFKLRMVIFGSSALNVYLHPLFWFEAQDMDLLLAVEPDAMSADTTERLCHLFTAELYKAADNANVLYPRLALSTLFHNGMFTLHVRVADMDVADITLAPQHSRDHMDALFPVQFTQVAGVGHVRVLSLEELLHRIACTVQCAPLADGTQPIRREHNLWRVRKDTQRLQRLRILSSQGYLRAKPNAWAADPRSSDVACAADRGDGVLMPTGFGFKLDASIACVDIGIAAAAKTDQTLSQTTFPVARVNGTGIATLRATVTRFAADMDASMTRLAARAEKSLTRNRGRLLMLQRRCKLVAQAQQLAAQQTADMAGELLQTFQTQSDSLHRLRLLVAQHLDDVPICAVPRKYAANLDTYLKDYTFHLDDAIAHSAPPFTMFEENDELVRHTDASTMVRHVLFAAYVSFLNIIDTRRARQAHRVALNGRECTDICTCGRSVQHSRVLSPVDEFVERAARAGGVIRPTCVHFTHRPDSDIMPPVMQIHRHRYTSSEDEFATDHSVLAPVMPLDHMEAHVMMSMLGNVTSFCTAPLLRRLHASADAHHTIRHALVDVDAKILSVQTSFDAASTGAISVLQLLQKRQSDVAKIGSISTTPQDVLKKKSRKKRH